MKGEIDYLLEDHDSQWWLTIKFYTQKGVFNRLIDGYYSITRTCTISIKDTYK